MRRCAPFILLVLLVLAACDPLSLPQATPTPNPTATPSAVPATDTPMPTDTPEATDIPVPPQVVATVTPLVPAGTGTPNGSGANAEVQRELAEVESDTVKLRGLVPKTSVHVEFISPDQMRKNLAAEVAQDYPRDEARQDATTLWLLQLLDDPTIDLYQLQIDLLGEQVLGYYDHKKKELFVRSGEATLSPLALDTLAHEFTHNLQDQYFDLSKLRPDKIENDKGNAVLALVEGDAVASQLAYARNYMTQGDIQKLIDETNSISQSVLEHSPQYIHDSLNFPYEQGPDFISELAAAQPGSFKAVNDALADPPQSTEQILHPEKYLDKQRDQPIPIMLPPLTSTLGAGWSYKDTDTLGEFDFKEMMQINGAANPDDASAGWGGARYALYEKGDKALLLMQSKWDTKNDATEFNDGLQQTLSKYKKSGGLWSDDKRTFGIKSSGTGVTLVVGTDRAAVQAVLAAVKP